ncbi:MAG TPA: undecaprenyl/decaprenyl-phosphate alpha-N-acetylglucosaminyl 1-phosphate transferase, partial [Bacillota bacterium]|nr:undecaprenyl/decaprenyl-phosphate alpha-N-acetylglucosaminyl 1-phosphate transferase [Bacillota bacterium]
MSLPFKAFLTALFVALVLTPVAIKLAPKIGAMDIPRDERRVHKEPMPRFGGTAMFFAIMISIAAFVKMDAQILGITVGAVLMFLLGLVDDFRNLSPKVKFLGQVICSVIVWFYTLRINGV